MGGVIRLFRGECRFVREWIRGASAVLFLSWCLNSISLVARIGGIRGRVFIYEVVV